MVQFHLAVYSAAQLLDVAAKLSVTVSYEKLLKHHERVFTSELGPKPNRLTVKSPSSIVPASAAPWYGSCSTRDPILSKPQRARVAFSERVRLWHILEVSVSIRKVKLLRVTLIVKRGKHDR
jgi:hypothetical protein